MELALKQAGAAPASSSVESEIRTAYALLTAGQGNLPAARRELDAVLSKDPSFPAAANARAAIDAIEGKVGEAAGSFSKILGRSPIDPLVRANLGQALWLAGRYDEAREHLLAAAEVLPKNPYIRAALGETALRKGDSAGAVRELRAALASCSPGGEGAVPERKASNRLELELSGPEGSKTAGCARARTALAAALASLSGEKLGDAAGRREGLRLASEAIDLGAAGAVLAQALFVRGTVELYDGQDARARADLEKALASGLLDPLKSAARNNLGVAFYRTGSTAEAQRQFELARQGSPKAAASILNLGIVHHDAREPEKALALYDEYVALGGRRGEDARSWADGIRRLYR
jgi:Tfp pilus assembly protein PilF